MSLIGFLLQASVSEININSFYSSETFLTIGIFTLGYNNIQISLFFLQSQGVGLLLT